MLIIIYSFISLLIIFSSSNPYVFLSFGIIIITNYFLFNLNIKNFFFKILGILPFYLTLLLLYCFFYNEGRIIYLFDSFKVYVDGFYLGLDLFIRCVCFSVFIFSLNLTDKAKYIIDSISNSLRNYKYIKRLLNIIFLSLYFIDKFMNKFIEKAEGKKIRHFTSFVKKALLDMEKEISEIKQTDNLNFNKKSLDNKAVIMLGMVLLVIGFNIIAGGFFEKLF